MSDLCSIRDQINMYMPDLDTMYEQMLRHQFFMPAKTCSIVSVKFMDGIIREDIYCPRMYELRPIVLAKPPHKKHLKEELLGVMALQAEA